MGSRLREVGSKIGSDFIDIFVRISWEWDMEKLSGLSADRCPYNKKEDRIMNKNKSVRYEVRLSLGEGGGLVRVFFNIYDAVGFVDENNNMDLSVWKVKKFDTEKVY